MQNVKLFLIKKKKNLEYETNAAYYTFANEKFDMYFIVCMNEFVHINLLQLLLIAANKKSTFSFTRILLDEAILSHDWSDRRIKVIV